MSDRLKRVLIVDDEEDLTWTLSKKLSKDSDKFELITVNSGREAISVLNQLPVDLVITDVRMPEVSGLDLLVNIRNHYPNTKVIIMTAYGTSDVQKEANERGCFHYIEKPFEINELRQLILDALTQRKGFKGSVSDFQLSDIIQLNCLGRLTSALRVTCDDEEGIIYFSEGNIIHAEAAHLEGEAAFNYIMSWHGGEFNVLRHYQPVNETITRGWQSLLLESLRLLDENSDLAKQEAEREKRKRQRRLKQIFSRIYDADGVEHVFLHTLAGFPLFYSGPMSDKKSLVTELGNQISTIREGVSQTTEFMRGGEIEMWEIKFDKRVFIMQHIPKQDACLTIIGKAKTDTSFIRKEIEENLEELAGLL